jgi:hypothetical protein
MCSKAHPHVRALFARCDGLVLPQLNDTEASSHTLDGRIEDVAIKMPNLLMEGKFALMFKVEGLQIFVPL